MRASREELTSVILLKAAIGVVLTFRCLPSG